MKRRMPAKVVEVCDRCREESSGLFEACLVCGRSVCFRCAVTVLPGCVIHVELCRECSKRADVRRLVDFHAPRIDERRQERDLELKSLPRTRFKRSELGFAPEPIYPKGVEVNG